MKPDIQLTRTNFWIIVTNSTASYVLAFLFLFYISHFVKIIFAINYSYDIGFDYGKIFFYIEPHEWTHDSVKLIYSAGPILIFVIGLISLIAFWSLVEEPARIKTFFMWLVLHSFNYFFGGLIIGNIFKKGVGHVFNWMYLTDTTKMLVALFGFLGLVGTALIMTKPAAVSANSYFNKLDEKNFPFFVSAQLVIPFILGTLIYIGYFLPYILVQEIFSWISLALLLLIIIIKISRSDTLYFDEETRYINVSPTIVVTAIVILVVFRVLLRNEIFISW